MKMRVKLTLNLPRSIPKRPRKSRRIPRLLGDKVGLVLGNRVNRARARLRVHAPNPGRDRAPAHVRLRPWDNELDLVLDLAVDRARR